MIMQTKKCPKCGAEIPIEMSFCLHCMERTDEVLEIKRKTAFNKKYIIIALAVFAVMAIIIIILIANIIADKNNNKDSEIPAPVASETTTGTTEIIPITETVMQTETITTSEITTTKITNTSTQYTTEKPISYETHTTVVEDKITDDSEIPVEYHADNGEEPQKNIDIPETESPVYEYATENIVPQTVESIEEPEENKYYNFEELFMNNFNHYEGSHIIADTLNFNENSCTFSIVSGTEQRYCELTANDNFTEFTVTVSPESDFSRFVTSGYIADITGELAYFVFGYEINDIRNDIRNMFENMESYGEFCENNFNCTITTQEHNSGNYPVTINCYIN